MDCTLPPAVHLRLALLRSHKVHVQGICCAHCHGNRGTTTPSCCHLLGYSYGHGLCDERSIRVDLSKQILSHTFRIPTDKVLALSLGNPLRYVRIWRWFRNDLMTSLPPNYFHTFDASTSTNWATVINVKLDVTIGDCKLNIRNQLVTKSMESHLT